VRLVLLRRTGPRALRFFHCLVLGQDLGVHIKYIRFVAFRLGSLQYAIPDRESLYKRMEEGGEACRQLIVYVRVCMRVCVCEM
jgi:hypothetical protein